LTLSIDTAYYIDELNRKNYNFEWFVYILSTIWLDEISRDTGIPGLNRDDVYSRKIPLPPLEEQKVIVDFIEQETATIDKAIELSKKEIELLEEYKTRLIADVVTGAVDVREEAQNLPKIEEDSTAFESDMFEAKEEGGDE
jgi:type I restriction enzyme S subunit